MMPTWAITIGSARRNVARSSDCSGATASGAAWLMRVISHPLEYWRRPRAHRVVILALLVVHASAAKAQSADTARRVMTHVMAQVIPVITRATPTAGRRSLTEAYLAQPMIMLSIERAAVQAIATV